MPAGAPGAADAPPDAGRQLQHAGVSRPARALAACAAREQRFITQADPPAACPLRQRLTAQASITRAGRAALASARAARLRPHPPRAQAAAAVAQALRSGDAGSQSPASSRGSRYYDAGEQGTDADVHTDDDDEFVDMDDGAAEDVADCTQHLARAVQLVKLSKLDAQGLMIKQWEMLIGLEQQINRWLLRGLPARGALPLGLLERLAMGLAGRNGDPKTTACMLASAVDAKAATLSLFAAPHGVGCSPQSIAHDERGIEQGLASYQGAVEEHWSSVQDGEVLLRKAEEIERLVRVHDLRPWQQPATLDCVMRLLALCAYLRHPGGMPAQPEEPGQGDYPWVRACVLVPVSKLSRWLPDVLTLGSCAPDALDAGESDMLPVHGARGGPEVLWRKLARWELELAMQLLMAAAQLGSSVMEVASWRHAHLHADEDADEDVLLLQQQRGQGDELIPAEDVRDELVAGLGTFAAVAWVCLGNWRYGGLRVSHPQLVLSCIWDAWQEGMVATKDAVCALARQAPEAPCLEGPGGRELLFDTDTLVGYMLVRDRGASTRLAGLPLQLPSVTAGQMLQARFTAAARALEDHLFHAVLDQGPGVLDAVLQWWKVLSPLAKLGRRQEGAAATAAADGRRESPAEHALRRCGAPWLVARWEQWAMLMQHRICAAAAADPQAHPDLRGFCHNGGHHVSPSSFRSMQLEVVRRAVYMQPKPGGLWVLLLGAESAATWLVRALLASCEANSGRGWCPAFYPAAVPMPQAMEEPRVAWLEGQPGEEAAYEPLPGQSVRVVVQLLPPRHLQLQLPPAKNPQQLVEVGEATSVSAACASVLANARSGLHTVLRVHSGAALAAALLATAKARCALGSSPRTRDCDLVVLAGLAQPLAKAEAWTGAAQLLAGARAGVMQMRRGKEFLVTDTKQQDGLPGMSSVQVAAAVGACAPASGPGAQPGGSTSGRPRAGAKQPPANGSASADPDNGDESDERLVGLLRDSGWLAPIYLVAMPGSHALPLQK